MTAVEQFGVLGVHGDAVELPGRDLCHDGETLTVADFFERRVDIEDDAGHLAALEGVVGVGGLRELTNLDAQGGEVLGCPGSTGRTGLDRHGVAC